MLERGDVCWATLAGLGRKPVVVVSSVIVSTALRPIVVRVTTVDRPRVIATTVALADGEAGLTHPSWIVCHDVFTLEDGADLEAIGRLSASRMLDVEDALALALDLR